MAETQKGTTQLWGCAGTITIGGVARTALVQSVRLTHVSEKREIKNSSGQTVGVIYPDDEKIEATFEFIASGTDATTAKTSAGMPALGTSVITASFPVIIVGSFTDALNSATPGQWLYEGGHQINLTNDGAVTCTVTLTRYDNITIT